MCESKKEYNGYSNYETWVVNLWINNDEKLYNEIKNSVEPISKECDGSNVYTINEVNKLADHIHKWVYYNMPKVKGMFYDLLNNSIKEVNYREIAESILDFSEREDEKRDYCFKCGNYRTIEGYIDNEPCCQDCSEASKY